MGALIDQQDLKREKILEAAHQRFLHYGYSKTTMNEIAGDLSFSKALLYYYFPDKSQLYIAVMQRLADDYIALLQCKMNSFPNLKEAFVFQINTQHNFIRKNYNFFDFLRINEQNLPDSIWGIIESVHQLELKLLVSTLNSEIQKGIIRKVNNPEEIIGLLLNALHGVRDSNASPKKVVFHNMENLDQIREKRILLADIFIEGLNS